MSGSGGKCVICGKQTNQRCQACKIPYYCSQEHLEQDWGNHKEKCKQYRKAQQVNSSQITVNSNANKEQVITKEQNGIMNNAQFNQKQESNTPNLSISSNNAVSQPNNNLAQINSSMISSNQNQQNQATLISTPGNIKTSRQSNNAALVDQQSPQISNSFNYTHNNQNNTNQNTQNIQINGNENIIQKQYYKDPEKLQKDRELQQLMSERLAFRSDVVKLLAKFNYSDALIQVRNLCKISEQIYRNAKRQDQNELYELLADQLLEVKIMIKTQSSNANKEAGTKLQDIFHKIKSYMNDNTLKNYYQDLEVEKKNEFMNEIRKRCNLISLVANLFYSLGHQNECEEAYVRYVKLIETVMGQDALETSNCYFLMGVYYLQHRYYIKALACFKRSMSIRSQRLTERHESVTDCQYNIGIAYKQLGRKQKALDQLEKTLFIRRQIIGQSSLPVAQTLEILGKIYMESPSDYPIALDKFQECYSIRKSIIKVNKHPDMVRISLLIVHLYNLIKAQLAQQEASQPTKQAQQLKDIELKMQKNVIDGNIQQYIQTQKNNPDRFQELQNQYGLYNNEMQLNALNQANAIQKQQNQASSQALLPDNSVDDFLKGQNQSQNNSQNVSATNNNNKSNSANSAVNSVMNSIIKPSGGVSDKNYGFGLQRGSVANSFQLREREGSKQSTDSNSPSKTIQEEEQYQPQKKSNQSGKSKSKKRVSEEISEDSDNSDEDLQEKNIKKHLLKLKERTISRITHQQFQELVNINEKVAREMKKDPKFNPRDMIINSVFVQNMKQMDYRDICQDLIEMNPQYFGPEDFSDLRYFGTSNDVNSQQVGNTQFDQKMSNQFQQQPSPYDYQQQNNFQNQNSMGSFGKQSQYQQNGFYQMSEDYSFPQNFQKPRPESNSFKKYQDERTDMQMDPNEDFMDILNKKPSNRNPSRDGNQKFGANNNYGISNSSNQYNQTTTTATKNVRIASQEVYQYNNQKRDFESENVETPPLGRFMSEENTNKILQGLSKLKQ
ncbi:formin domain protein (macronuclear) [Tetrahymena thermophila SB210]|uniref:Formin domain protein n=1 Tax=Tetrahymena thermophila (strain SB210) TaxID=312017 RepID=I7MAH4_TETTS|nr:formin domain protein [Tetrahymena thermophila SB210]EAS04600.2 formin domain protein [Tetrahymena thermophila SB210]|eukprot:XP_001024845.2 formin domain protein [Tetrahymena thermophila SB210]